MNKARSLHLPPNVGLLFLPPYAPELNPIERLWRDLKDGLASSPPPTLEELSAFLTTRLRHYSPARGRSLTGFPSFVAAARLANAYSSSRIRIIYIHLVFMSTPSGGAARSHWAPYGANEDRTEVSPGFYDEIFQTDICRKATGNPAVDEAITYGTPAPVGRLYRA